MRDIRVGIVGGGFMCKAHVNGYLTARYMFPNLNARAVLEAICVRTPGKARLMAERYGFSSAYESVCKLLADDRIDLYDICIPAESHGEAVFPIIEAGKTVLCEKPLSLHAAEAKQMVLTAKARGIQNYVGFNYRFMPAVRMARNMLEEGVLGRVRHMRVSYFQQNGADSDKQFEQIRYIRTPDCGSLQEIGTHAIDQMRFLVGELCTVSAITANFTPERKTEDGKLVSSANEDMAAAVVTFENGVTGSLECSGAYFGKKNQLSWEIFCSKGSVSWNLENPNYLGVYQKDSSIYTDGVAMVNVTGGDYPYAANWWPGAHNLGWEHGHINMIAGILENMAAGAPVQPVATFLDGYRASVIVEAIRESSRTGKRIDLTARYQI